MKILVLAGGYGTRLYPLVKDTPKALLEVAGRTLIDHTLAKFAGLAGVAEIVVVTNDRFYPHLTAWSRTRPDPRVPLRVVNDGTRTPEERLGAVGDILFVLEREARPGDWWVVGSDNLFDAPLPAFFAFAREKRAPLVGCYNLGDPALASRYGVLELGPDGRLLSLEEKPAAPRSALISMCLYYFPEASLSFFRGFLDETGKPDTTGGFIQWLVKKTPVYGFPFSGQWYDIGSVDSYNEAQRGFLRSGPQS